MVHMCRDYHSRVVKTRREKQKESKVDGDLVSLNENSQELSTLDNLVGFQTEHSVMVTTRKGEKQHESEATLLLIFDFACSDKNKRKALTKDKEHYLHYTPLDLHSEQG